MSRARLRAKLLLVVIVLLGLSNVAAICFGSGAWKVFTHADGFIVIDSTGTLFGTTDDGETWAPTRTLPRERTKFSDEVCVDSDTCYRIRPDRLGIEVGSGESWTTSWEYSSARVSYLGRQLPGPCGDGHADLGLTGMAPTYEGSRWVLVVAAGADGVLGLDHAGNWVRDVYTTPSADEAGLADVYLVPELLTAALALIGLAVVFGFHDRTEVARAILAAFLGWAGAVGVWVASHSFGVDSTFLRLLLAAVPLIGLAIWCAGRYCDLSELLVGGFLGTGVAVGGAAVEMSHDDFTFSIVLAVIGMIVLGAGAFAARDQLGKWSLQPSDWMVVVSVLGVGVLLAMGVYPLWVWGWIGPRALADGLALLVIAVVIWIARRIWSGRVNLESVRPT